MTMAAFISFFLDLKRRRDRVYATDTTKNVDSRQFATAMITVLLSICGKLKTVKSVKSLT